MLVSFSCYTIQYNTIQYKNEYYYSGINPVEFQSHMLCFFRFIFVFSVCIIIFLHIFESHVFLAEKFLYLESAIRPT